MIIYSYEKVSEVNPHTNYFTKKSISVRIHVCFIWITAHNRFTCISGQIGIVNPFSLQLHPFFQFPTNYMILDTYSMYHLLSSLYSRKPSNVSIQEYLFLVLFTGIDQDKDENHLIYKILPLTYVF